MILEQETLSLLFESYECLRLLLGAELQKTTINKAKVVARTNEIFAQLEETIGSYNQEEIDEFPSAETLGIDVVKYFFQDIVPEKIEEIVRVLENPQLELVQQVLQEVGEVFIGLAESLKLPGFGAIARATLTALNTQPELAITIAATALKDFQAARELVLGGERERGGEPSLALQQLALGKEGKEEEEYLGELVDNIWGKQIATVEEVELITNPDDFSNIFSQTVPGKKTKIETREERKRKRKRKIATREREREIEGEQKEKASVAANQTIRVNLEGLQELDRLVGELLVEQNKNGLKEQQIQTILGQLINKVEQSQEILNQRLPELKPELKPELELEPAGKGEEGEKSPPWQQIVADMGAVAATAENLKLLTKESSQNLHKQQRMLFHMRDELLDIRMVPLEKIFSRFAPLIQQLNHSSRKQVELILTGSHILVDKAMEQKLYDPLLHLVRNAFDHGIELPEIRRKLGKSEQGTIEIRAYYQGSKTIIEVKDDGQGLNLELIKQRGLELNLISPGKIVKESKLLELLFEPRFSTSSQVSELSGRGVGLDVVRSQLEALKGSIAIESTSGEGTTFSLSYPLTLSIAKLMVCEAGGMVYALLPSAIEKILLPQEREIEMFGGGKVLHWQGETGKYTVPVRRLADLLQYGRKMRPKGGEESYQVANPVLLLRRKKGFFGLEVDGVLGEKELAIRPLGSALIPPSYVYGCSILSNSRLSLVIDGTALVGSREEEEFREVADQGIVEGTGPLSLPGTVGEKLLPQSKSDVLLVVDDSSSFRRSLALTLEKEGYEVLQGENGLEGLALLKQFQGVRLVISDLDMPEMNGFEFLKAIKADFQDVVSVAIMTSHEEEQYQMLAKQLGAKAYFTKPYLEEELLRGISDLLSGDYPPKSPLSKGDFRL